ncbi:MAG: sulfite exporter TauE/SafE family protein [Bacteroidales bacterium]|nr:sulfite exporter TauE/SafE family protein [Bacteroidales bacterium]MBN2819532.1 sulfite exporter TauE/SafE family protein [Bacteroidales bacterium]
MIEVFQVYNLDFWHWILFALCGLFIGMAKTGLSGLGLMVVPLMAGLFGGRESVGILLPVLIVADFFAVKYFNRHASWKHVIRLLPWAMVGILTGAYFGHEINDTQFKKALAVIIVLGIGIMLWQDLRSKKVSVPDSWWFAAVLGLAGGFTTMVGNAAGPVMALYLLSMRLPKNIYIGTGAWFFLIINISKVPLHVFYWETIKTQTLLLDLTAIPVVIIGAIAGKKIVDIIPEKIFRALILFSTLAAALFLF